MRARQELDHDSPAISVIDMTKNPALSRSIVWVSAIASGFLLLGAYHGMKGDRERSLEAGFDDHLTKPIRREWLAKLIDSMAAPSGQLAAP